MNRTFFRQKRVAIEVSRQWRRSYAKTINELIEADVLTRGFVVYRGNERFRSGHESGLPVEDFLTALHTESILS